MEGFGPAQKWEFTKEGTPIMDPHIEGTPYIITAQVRYPSFRKS